jgi:hypothetical protein
VAGQEVADLKVAHNRPTEQASDPGHIAANDRIAGPSPAELYRKVLCVSDEPERDPSSFLLD